MDDSDGARTVRDEPASAAGPTIARLTTAGADRFLRDHLGPDVHATELIGEGAWSRCFGFTHRDRDLVIRFGAHVDDFHKDRRAGRFASAALPVPEVVEIAAAADGWFAIATRANGSFLEDADIDEWSALLPSILAMLDGLRAVDLSDTSGWGLWSATGDAPHGSWPAFLLSVGDDRPEMRTHGWRSKLATSPRAGEAFDRCLDALTGLSKGLAVERHLVHADLLHGNVLVHGEKIAAVLDWGSSLYGDFLYDVAWMAFWAPWHPGLAGVDIPTTARSHLSANALEVTDYDRRLRCCLLHIGLDHMAYNAHTKRWDELMRVTAATEALLED